MANSPLSSALKPNVSAGADAEGQYQQALTQLMEQLDVRKNRAFDPSMLALASGFLSPTQTGGFGESLGNAAKGYGAAQAQQQKEDIDLAQMRLQVAHGAREQASRLAGQEAFRKLTGNAPPTLNAPSGAGGVPTGGAPTGGAGMASPDGSRPISIDDALRFASAFPENKDMGKLLMDAAKFNADRYKIAMNGTVFDTLTSQYITQIPPGQTASNYFVPETDGNVLMTPGQYADYQAKREKGLGKQWVQDFMSKEGPKVKADTTPVTTPATGEDKKTAKILTQADIEAEKAGKEVTARETAKAESERLQNAINKADDAGERLSMYNRLKVTAQKPDANKIFGVFENGKFSDAVFKYLEANNGIISAKNIRDLWTEVGLDPKQISDKQLALSIIAQQQFAFSSLAKGQGAISDFERSLFNAMGASIQDRPETIVRKMDMLSARAEFDREIGRMARKARDNGIKYDNMKDSPEYQQAYDKYVNKLMNIVEGSGKTVTQPSSSSVPASSQNKPKNPAADKLREELGIK